MAPSVSALVQHCHAWNRGYCGHGFEAAIAGCGGQPLTLAVSKRSNRYDISKMILGGI